MNVKAAAAKILQAPTFGCSKSSQLRFGQKEGAKVPVEILNGVASQLQKRLNVLA
jgi:hypothetical protein